MNDWWKSPVLQGPENDYGEYDYLIEDIPSYEEKWSWYFEKCDTCRKEHYLNLGATSYFRTMDGWDSIYCCECWKCYLKRKIKAPFKAITRTIRKKVVYLVEYHRDVRRLKQTFKAKNRPITEEVKEIIRDIAKREAIRRSKI